MCVVAAELRLLLLHAVASLCCMLYDVPHYENEMPRKALLSNTIQSILYVPSLEIAFVGKTLVPRLTFQVLITVFRRDGNGGDGGTGPDGKAAFKMVSPSCPAEKISPVGNSGPVPP